MQPSWALELSAIRTPGAFTVAVGSGVLTVPYLTIEPDSEATESALSMMRDGLLEAGLVIGSDIRQLLENRPPEWHGRFTSTTGKLIQPSGEAFTDGIAVPGRWATSIRQAGDMLLILVGTTTSLNVSTVRAIGEGHFHGGLVPVIWD